MGWFSHAWRAALGAALLVGVPGAAVAGGGVYGGVQFLMLAPKINSDGFNQVFYDEVDFSLVGTEGSFEDDLEGGVRFVFGAETCCGFGGRVRYFTFDNDVDYDGLWVGSGGSIPVQGQSAIDVDALDLEVTQRFDCCCWNMILGGGLRHGAVDILQPPNFFSGVSAVLNSGQTGVEFDGVGPTFSIGASRCLGYGLSVVGQARTSLLFGDIDMTRAFALTNRTIEDEFVQVWEFQLGLNYQTRLGGHDVAGGVFWEAQRWDSDSNFLGDLGLHGLGLSGGVSF
ncbi:MAG: Lpg1974 family pore-forming outer membrane protein [Planctomycetota bacterium]